METRVASGIQVAETKLVTEIVKDVNAVESEIVKDVTAAERELVDLDSVRHSHFRATQITSGRTGKALVNFAQTKDKVLLALSAIVVTGGVSWCGWMTSRAASIVPAEEIRRLIQTEAPYTADKKTIAHQLEMSQRSDERLTEVIEKNTEAINSLRIEISKRTNQP